MRTHPYTCAHTPTYPALSSASTPSLSFSPLSVAVLRFSFSLLLVRSCAVLGSTWLTVAVEASKHADAKVQLRGLLSAIMFEAPMRSMPGVELRLYNIQSASNAVLEDLDSVNGISGWRDHGRLSAYHIDPAFGMSKFPNASSEKIEGATAVDDAGRSLGLLPYSRPLLIGLCSFLTMMLCRNRAHCELCVNASPGVSVRVSVFVCVHACVCMPHACMHAYLSTRINAYLSAQNVAMPQTVCVRVSQEAQGGSSAKDGEKNKQMQQGVSKQVG